MPEIRLLTQETIDKIAAGEVVERPSSVVKELVENAIDAGATAITVEIKDGGTSLIRITDNGCGIAQDQVRVAFLRHSTSKIRSIEDLLGVTSLGFRGEALSSISAVSRVEMITKTREALTGTRYVIEGSKEQALEEIGAPDGTTFLIRDLFYNTPARKKFLKTPQTEGNYITDIVEKLALSHPDVSFKYIQNNQTKLHTSGNGSLKDLIYHVFGREIAASVLEVKAETGHFSVKGYIGKPVVARGNRNYENYFINGRYVKSSLLAKAIEDAYKSYMMQHQYPFTVLYFTFPGDDLDVNVHPTKMELRFGSNQEVYRDLCDLLFEVLSHKDMIPTVPVKETAAAQLPQAKPSYTEPVPEPFEKRRINDLRKAIAKDSPYEARYEHRSTVPTPDYTKTTAAGSGAGANRKPDSRADQSAADLLFNTPSFSTRTTSAEESKASLPKPEVINLAPRKPAVQLREQSTSYGSAAVKQTAVTRETTVSTQAKAAKTPYASEQNSPPKMNSGYEEITLEQISPDFLTKDARRKHKIIGQLFDTYWLIEYEDKLYIIDQHAAHEKVLYERTMKRLADQDFTSQTISPPIIMTLDAREQEMLHKYSDQIRRMGYEVEPFGGKEFMITAIPDNLFHMDMKDLFIEMLDDFSNITGRETPNLILEKVASMSCKAAVKGNNRLSLAEIDALIDELLSLDNPYNCPHGRPTIISMTKYEIEKKFKRIV